MAAAAPRLTPLLLELGGNDAAIIASDITVSDELVERLGLGGLLGRYPEQLSGGQQQRVAIGRALAVKPLLLLADEPTGNLDEETRDEIMDLLEGLWRDRGLTLIIVTHDSAVAKRAQRRLNIKHGQVKEVA